MHCISIVPGCILPLIVNLLRSTRAFRSLHASADRARNNTDTPTVETRQGRADRQAEQVRVGSTRRQSMCTCALLASPTPRRSTQVATRLQANIIAGINWVGSTRLQAIAVAVIKLAVTTRAAAAAAAPRYRGRPAGPPRSTIGRSTGRRWRPRRAWGPGFHSWGWGGGERRVGNEGGGDENRQRAS